MPWGGYLLVAVSVHVRRVQQIPPARNGLDLNPAVIQEQFAKQWQIFAQNNAPGNITEFMFTPSATSFPPSFDPWACILNVSSEPSPAEHEHTLRSKPRASSTRLMDVDDLTDEWIAMVSGLVDLPGHVAGDVDRGTFSQISEISQRILEGHVDDHVYLFHSKKVDMSYSSVAIGDLLPGYHFQTIFLMVAAWAGVEPPSQDNGLQSLHLLDHIQNTLFARIRAPNQFQLSPLGQHSSQKYIHFIVGRNIVERVLLSKQPERINISTKLGMKREFTDVCGPYTRIRVEERQRTSNEIGSETMLDSSVAATLGDNAKRRVCRVKQPARFSICWRTADAERLTSVKAYISIEFVVKRDVDGHAILAAAGGGETDLIDHLEAESGSTFQAQTESRIRYPPTAS
ncbi:hypothetical protein BDZ89DRAFT_1050850 [Hymenopellis radicata]|nr:hypothetical protein BDZ89DRAFT_1050850 [Hymenopellis radicata]